MLVFLQNNPQLAHKAGAAAVTFASENPEIAASAAQGARQQAANKHGFA
jgi:hypothetical protein